MNLKPCRGDIWMANLDPITGHEQGGMRPCLVISDDLLNHGPSELVIVLPVTTRNGEIPLRVPVVPPEGGLQRISYVMPEMIRSVSVRRLTRRVGAISPATMLLIESRVATVLALA
ncbi:MAG: type II toxin-antitoxin system PemK/MazF family toxin [Candidatus Hydrogenedentes bacterium]|nr:type II toxin-antitoxin system PemK/MazF family toxin [Candidatus Hydrogenedentota bacterium]